MIFMNVLVLDLSCSYVFVFLCLCVYVYMSRSRVDEPSGFRVCGFVRCPRRFLTINETSLSREIEKYIRRVFCAEASARFRSPRFEMELRRSLHWHSCPIAKLTTEGGCQDVFEEFNLGVIPDEQQAT